MGDCLVLVFVQLWETLTTDCLCGEGLHFILVSFAGLVNMVVMHLTFHSAYC